MRNTRRIVYDRSEREDETDDMGKFSNEELRAKQTEMVEGRNKR